MTTPDKLNELDQAELPARDLLVKLGYTYVPREVLAASAADALLTGRVRMKVGAAEARAGGGT